MLKSDYYSEYKILLEEFEPVLPKLGSGYNIDPDNVDGNELKSGVVWFREILHTLGKEAMDIYKLSTPEEWRRAELMGFSDHREVAMLRTAKEKIRRVLLGKSRPKVFKTTKRKLRASKQTNKSTKQEG